MSVQQIPDIVVESENVTEYGTLRRGDQIAVEGETEGIEYSHHGIFLGHEKVADFGGADKKNAELRLVNLQQFTNFGERRLVRIKYPEGHCLSSEEAAQSAEKLLADPSSWGPYDLVDNNCEHFATKCKTGKAISRQVIAMIRECIRNPLEIFRYRAASSGMTTGSLGSLGSLGSK